MWLTPAAGRRKSHSSASLIAMPSTGYRVAGGIFLVLWAGGRLSWKFALPAGIGDVTFP
jgi:hypothetical protein